MLSHSSPSSAMMRAMVMSRYGGPEVLEQRFVEVPDIGEDQLLVRVAGCGVCGHDLLARRGALGTALPVVLGHEISGHVAAVGPAVRDFAVGDRVALVQRIPCGACRVCQRGATNLCRAGAGFYGEDLAGGYAEYAVASPLNAVRVPDVIPLELASILSCGVGTGYRALLAAETSAGDVVVVTGAGGGVGIHTIEMAAGMGARVLAVTSSRHKIDALVEAGAHRVHVLGSGSSIREAVRLSFDEPGADVVIEIAGPPTFAESLPSLRAGGSMVLVGNTDPRQINVNPGLLILKEIVIRGSAHASLQDLQAVMDLAAAGRVRPVVAELRPLHQARLTHEELDARAIAGRIVLVPEPKVA